MPKKRKAKLLSSAVILLLAVLFVIKFAGPRLLRLYVESGIGNCGNIPILCMVPDGKIIAPDINKDYLKELLPYRFEKMEVWAPKGFNVVQEMIKKFYYKKHRRMDRGAVIYLLYEEPGFFVNLFPRLKRQGINDNYEFIKRLVNSRITGVQNITDVFFVIMKSIFTPDLGDQKKVTMMQFKIDDKRGFINYNLGKTGNFFDCNVVNAEDGFFKVYIKDVAGHLDLNKIFAIISTLKGTVAQKNIANPEQL